MWGVWLTWRHNGQNQKDVSRGNLECWHHGHEKGWNIMHIHMTKIENRVRCKEMRFEVVHGIIFHVSIVDNPKLPLIPQVLS